MINDPQRLQHLLERYHTGTATPAEITELFAWIKASEHDAPLQAFMQQQWANMNIVVPENEVNWDHMFNGIIHAAPVVEMQPSNNKKTWWRIAAAAVLVLGLSLTWLLNREPAKPASLTVTPVLVKPTEAAVFSRNIVLPDGSKVVLHAGSTLVYPAAFSGNTREVALNGEAFFDIAHNPQKPFIIQSNGVKTTVLGTAFNIQAYPGKAVTVTVTRGKVKVEDKKALLATLTPDKELQYDPATAASIERSIAAATKTGWTQAELVFDDASFADVAKRISNRYQTGIRFNDEAIQHCRVRVSFSGTETLDEVMTVLCAIRNSSYTMEGNTVVINGEPCK